MDTRTPVSARVQSFVPLAFLVRGVLALGCLARSPVRLRLVGRRSRPSESPPCSNTILASRRRARLPSNSRGVWSSARTIADEMEIVMADVDEVGPALVWDWSHAFAGGRPMPFPQPRSYSPTRPDPTRGLAVGVLARMSQPPAPRATTMSQTGSPKQRDE